MEHKEYSKKFVVPNNALSLQRIDTSSTYKSNKFWLSCPFPVKKIKFKFAYILTSDSITSYLVTCDLIPEIAIGSISTFARISGANVVLQDGFKEDNSFSWEFKDPALLNTNVDFYFKPLLVPSQIVSSQVSVLIECYG